MSSTVLYAPNVHTGGGLVLLQNLLAAWPANGGRTAFLDARASAQLNVPSGVRTLWVRPTIASRINGERKLRALTEAGDLLLCFHGLPPLLPNRARVVVFLQNRNLLGLNRLTAFSARTGMRLALERFMSARTRHRVAEYLVQTTTMARDLLRWYGVECPPIRVLPFADLFAVPPPGLPVNWDFVYVADGEAMKNHARLLQAWSLLAEQGLRPSLALTLGSRDWELLELIDEVRGRHALNVVNLGHLPRDDVLKLYRQAGALIFPSMSESFGLPLIEAGRMNVPIVASELDFIRDVCKPVQTFDPLSAVSIARAVRRFLGTQEALVCVTDASAFWVALKAGNVVTHAAP